jgi:hypothetical protein
VGEPLKRNVMRLRDFMNLKLALLSIVLFAALVTGQKANAPEFTRVTITMKAEGGPCDCVFPAYSVSADENGTVIYNGLKGVTVRGEKIHSISIGAVRDLVSDFLRIDFFSLESSYTSKKLPNGNSETIDHANATTISIDIDGKKKSVYIFYGAPQELIDLQRKLYEVTQIAQYTGRA